MSHDRKEIDASSEEGEVKSFLAHLEDFRKTILLIAGSLGVGMLIAIPFTSEILSLLEAPMARAGLDPDAYLKVTKIAGGFSIGLRIVFWGGMILSFPAVLYFVGGFIYPGLTQKERTVISRSLGAAGLLFAAGVALGYYVIIPMAIKVMTDLTHAVGTSYDFIELGDYVGFVLKLMLAFGLAFELPVVLMILGALGIVSAPGLRSRRRHVIVGLFVLAMFLTPADPWTMVGMALPMIGLYELSIIGIAYQQRDKPENAYDSES